MKKGVVAVVIGAITLGILVWGLLGYINSNLQKEDKVATITIWGFAEDEAVLKPVLDNYSLTHPKVKINFARQTLLNYRPRLLAQLQAGKGPDIFPIHNSWLPMFAPDLSGAPSNIYSINDYSKTFYPVAKDSLTLDNKVYAVPTELDGLVMFYNEEILNGVGMKPPKSWVEFLEAVRLTTVKNQAGQIVTAGAAMGTTNNIEHWGEIMGSLFYQQPNGVLSSPGNKDGSEVVQFYTSFTIDPKNKTWDQSFPPALKMFSDGRLAFYFGTYKRTSEIKALNPSLKFKTAPIPQLSSKSASVGSFWALGVSKRSRSQKEAWELLKYLTTSGTLQSINNKRVELGLAPKVYPIMEISSLQSQDPLMGPVISQGSIYKTWYLNPSITDGGINDEISGAYVTAITGVLNGGDPLGSLSNINSLVKDILTKYKVKN